jgi:hypothetical protein
MTKTQARNWAYAAAAAGVIANALFIAFYASFAAQHLTAPRGASLIACGADSGLPTGHL